MKKIAICTDSNAGILDKDVKDRGIFILPMPFIINGEEYFENVNLKQDEFYTLLDSDASVSTSQPSGVSVTEFWDSILENYDQIIYIPMSSGLSNSCANAIRLSEDYKDKVFVVDNQRISVTLKQSVLDAEKMVKDGKSAEQIVDYLTKTKLDSSIYIMVPNLKYLKKGGRLTPTAAMIGTLLNIKPVLQIQGGKLDAFAKVMAVKPALKTMIRAMKKDMEERFAKEKEAGKLKLYVAYTKDKDAGLDFKKQVEDELGMDVAIVDALSLSVACHIGPGALALACSVEY